MRVTNERANVIESWSSSVKMSDHKTPQAITVAATFTIEPILSPLQYVLHEAGLELDVRFSPYNQVFQELLTPASLLASNAGGFNLILLRVEDFIHRLALRRNCGATLKSPMKS